MTRVRFSSAALLSEPAAALKARAQRSMQMVDGRSPGRLLANRCSPSRRAWRLRSPAAAGPTSKARRSSASAPAEAALVPWPLFGRVPERTHYLPAKERSLDPPLREAWSINTHALIEFPPAVANGVAYVVNKYGNAKAVRLQRPQDPLGTRHQPEGRRQTDRRDRAGLPPGQGLLRLRRRQPGRGRRQERQAGLEAQARRPPRILADGGRRHALPRHRQDQRRRGARRRRQGPLAVQLAGGDQGQPQLPRRPRLRRRLRERRCSASTPRTAS